MFCSSPVRRRRRSPSPDDPHSRKSKSGARHTSSRSPISSDDEDTKRNVPTDIKHNSQLEDEDAVQPVRSTDLEDDEDTVHNVLSE
jgi:hypothetical protein